MKDFDRDKGRLCVHLNDCEFVRVKMANLVELAPKGVGPPPLVLKEGPTHFQCLDLYKHSPGVSPPAGLVTRQEPPTRVLAACAACGSEHAACIAVHWPAPELQPELRPSLHQSPQSDFFTLSNTE